MTTIKTVLHHYCLDTRDPIGKQDWKDLQEKLKPMLPLQMNSHSGGNQPITHRNDSEDVALSTSSLFDNQWNEEGGKNRRLFDWYLEYRLSGTHIKQGHWLEQTKGMIDIRNNTKKCGYCGNMTTGTEEFCTKCIGSEYLEEKDLYLTRYRPVSERPRQFPELTAGEKALLLPLYETAQGLGKANREALAHSKARKKVADLVPEARKKAAKLVEEAEKKTVAYTWLLDNKFRNLDNVIHYTHTDIFSFGWRKPYGKEEAAELRELLQDFPFNWEVKE